MKIEVSIGEIVDKWTILKIKSERITDKKKRLNILVERDSLEKVMREIYNRDDYLDVVSLAMKQEELYRINNELWDVEDALREMERNGDWQIVGSDFVPKARMVYRLNDYRAKLKREINELTGSALVEEKSYEEY